MPKSFRIGLIGCGLRGVWYLHTFRQSQMNFALVAVADPDRQYAQIASRIFADNKARIFIDGKDLLENSDVDAVIIASPNYVHCESAVLAMQRGVKFLLEKPVAASLEDMATMWQTQLQTGAAPVIGFCIRYTPFYKKVHEIASSGSLGKILAVNAEELMSDDLSVVFARGDWRPDHTKSGGLMAEKCSHDMDILNWIAGTEAETVSSFAARTFLTPRSDAGERCSKCNIADTCRFKHGLVPEIFETHWPPELHDVLTKVSDDTCVFSPHHTYPDHQSLNIQYKNGVISTFTVAQCQPATRRTIHVIGSDARLYGVVNDNRISVYRHGRLSEERVEVIEVNPDASGHNGGDSVLTRDFFALLEGQPNRSRPGLREGIEASLLSIAADQSALIGRPMSLDRLREKVFKTSGPLRQVQNPAPLSVVQS